MRVLLAGAPGAGKGTQAAALAVELGVPHLASGDLVRAGSASGTHAKAAVRDAVAAGDLLPDETVLELVLPRLLEAASEGGYVLDGFPRTVAQAQGVDDATAPQGAAPELAVHLDVPDDVLTGRLMERGRADDTTAVITHRLQVYRSRTTPMIHWYGQRDRLVVVEGNDSVARVSAAVVRGIQEWLLRRAAARRQAATDPSAAVAWNVPASERSAL